MRRFLTGLAIMLVVSSPAHGMRFAELSGDIALPIADGWEVVDSASGFPYRLGCIDEAAEMTIHQTILSGDDIIASQADLKASVDSVVSGLILDLPEARLLSNTGMQAGNWAAFALEFESQDPGLPSGRRHRLSGVLYYHPDGYQLLFTLWARSATQVWPLIIDDILFMQGGFVYLGQADQNALGGDGQELSWKFLAIPLLGIGFAQMLRATVQRQRSQRRRRVIASGPSPAASSDTV